MDSGGALGGVVMEEKVERSDSDGGVLGVNIWGCVYGVGMV